MFKFIIHDDNESKIDLGYLHSIETKFDFVFPNILKKYYLEHNGAEINEVSFEKYNVDFVIIELFTLKYGNDPIEEMIETNLKNEWIPNSFIPLALDEDYDIYYWDKNNKKVYYYCIENDENPVVIADSVDEFFELLNNNV